MERMFLRLTNMYTELCANSPPRQARAHGCESGQSHENWVGWRNGEEAGLPCEQSLRRKESKGFHLGQSWKLKVGGLQTLQPEGAEKAGRKQRSQRHKAEWCGRGCWKMRSQLPDIACEAPTASPASWEMDVN